MSIAILFAVQTDKQPTLWPTPESCSELKELSKTAGLKTVDILIQKRGSIHPSTYLGTGKSLELKELCKTHDATIVICDDELSPVQQKTLESQLEIKVTDRTGLILDIFSQRVSTHEAQLQVELAQLNYIRPRLTRMWTHLSRQGGGIGARGPGETQLEVDKRQIGKRIAHLKLKLEKVQSQRHITRKRRHDIPIVTGAIVGYTNAGKSTLINKLTKATVLAKDQLFATLDPTTRVFQLSNHENILLTDTVGFIQKLPHQLVTSFRATLEEVVEAHFLLHVIDGSHPNMEGMIQTANSIISDLNAQSLPQLLVLNKVDCIDSEQSIIRKLPPDLPYVFISAEKSLYFDNLDRALIKLLQSRRKVYTFRLPYSRMDIVNLLHKYGTIIEQEFDGDLMIYSVELPIITGDKIVSTLHLKSKAV